LITNIKRKKPSLDEGKNECGKTNEDKITSKCSYQISVAAIQSDVNVRFTTTRNPLILFCVHEKQGDESHETFIHRLIQERNLISLFPNTDIILRIYLSLMYSNCSGGRSFFKLKRIKNELRSSTSQQRLNHLSLMSDEHRERTITETTITVLHYNNHDGVIHACVLKACFIKVNALEPSSL